MSNESKNRERKEEMGYLKAKEHPLPWNPKDVKDIMHFFTFEKWG